MGTAILRTSLNDAIIAPCGLHHLSALPWRMADRLLNIHVLASLACPDGGQRVPVIWCGNDDRINRFIIECPAKIACHFGTPTLNPFDFPHILREERLIYIT